MQTFDEQVKKFVELHRTLNFAPVLRVYDVNFYCLPWTAEEVIKWIDLFNDCESVQNISAEILRMKAVDSDFRKVFERMPREYILQTMPENFVTAFREMAVQYFIGAYQGECPWLLFHKIFLLRVVSLADPVLEFELKE